MQWLNPKGTQEVWGAEQQGRQRVRQVLEEVFQIYGCKPMETPILSYYELLASKYGGGAEILKEVYRLTDQGERDLALRYDLTMPFVRFIGANPALRLPFKRYEIGKVFRDGPIKPGRYREFYQCDVDVVGVRSVLAEAELLMMASDAFERLGLEIEIEYNNRKLLTGILSEAGVAPDRMNDVLLTLDKLAKIGLDGVKEELAEKRIPQLTVLRIADLAGRDAGTVEAFAACFDQSGPTGEAVQELISLSGYFERAGIRGLTVFNPFLARGLNIYTGTIYEIFLKDRSLSSSLGSGGRYDSIIGQLLGTEERYPAVGLSFGLDTIVSALTLKGSGGIASPFVDLLIVPLGREAEAESLALAGRLRSAKIRTEIDMAGRRVGKSLEYAARECIPFVTVIGETEVQGSEIRLRDMVRSEESVFAWDDLAGIEEKIRSER